MMRTHQFLSALAASLGASLSIIASSASAGIVTSTPAGPHGSSPRLDAVFKSIQDNTAGDGISLPWMPLGIAAAAAILMTIAVKQWKRRRAAPRPLSNHRKLLDEASRAAGISKRKMKRIAPLTQADGLSSPLVAIICPSAIKRLARNVRTGDEQDALKSLAETLFRAEGRGRGAN